MKKIMEIFKPLIIFTMILYLSVCPSIAIADIGLSTRFSDAILEHLEIGGSYNITEIKNLPLTIINGSTVETDVQVEIDAPKPEELKEGYEPIPDPTWVKVVPDKFRLPPAGRNLSDIVITIPDDPKLNGRHFQVMFWAHTVGEGFFGVGVRVRIRFSVGSKSPESARAEFVKKRMLNLNFRLDPTTIGLGEIAVGKAIDLKKEKEVSVKLVNTGSTPLKLGIQSSKFVNPQRPPVGYEELPDISWLEVEPKVLKAKPDTITPLKIKVRIPDKPEYRGKKYVGLVTVSLIGEDIPVNVYSQILMTTEK